MKSLRKVLVLFLAFCLVFALAACGAAKRTNDETAPRGDYEYSEDMPAAYDTSIAGVSKASGEGLLVKDGDYGYESIAGEPMDTPYDTAETESKDEYETINPTAGLITASAWNENENYEFWKKLFRDGQGEDDGKFFDFYKNHNWGFDSTKRVRVTVKDGDTLVCGAVVACVNETGEHLFAARTGADGVANLFPKTTEGKILVSSGEAAAEATFTAENRELTVTLEASEKPENLIQIMLVVDVTGSMGDEIDYLKAELDDVIHRIAAANEGAKIELALLFYRDNGDSEKLAYYDFVNVNDPDGLALQARKLAAQIADGGGDTPEAVDEALQLAMEKSWNDSAATKIIFHVLDAPPHENGDGTQNNYEKRFSSAVISAAEQGVRICPILCSGADTLCEYVMRQASIYTGGTSIFVTNHSGIGGDHLDPDIPDMVVEKLNDLMVRLVNGYHAGVFAEPVEWQPNTQEQQ